MGDKIFSFSESEYDGPIVMKMRNVKLKPSYHKGVFVGSIIGKESGFSPIIMSLDLHHIPPDVKTGVHRHDETLLHVLTGRGYTIIDDIKYEWEPGDSIHIKPGAWHQHYNTSSEAANMLAAKATPLFDHIKPYPMEEREAGFAEIPEDFVPEHPFGLGKQEIVRNEAGLSLHFLWARKHTESLAQRMKEARTITKGREVRWEQSGGHEGELDASLIDPGIGFDTRIMCMNLQSLPPGGHNEMHRHGQAIVYIVSGRGYLLVDGRRIDWERGDTIYVPPKVWHQHWNSDKSRQAVQLRITPSGDLIRLLTPFPYIETKEDTSTHGVDPTYLPVPPW